MSLPRAGIVGGGIADLVPWGASVLCVLNSGPLTHSIPTENLAPPGLYLSMYGGLDKEQD